MTNMCSFIEIPPLYNYIASREIVVNGRTADNGRTNGGQT